MERKDNSTGLIEEIQNGDKTAFEKLAKLYKPLIDKMTSAYLSYSEYEDIRQEALLALYNTAMNYNMSQSEVSFGLYAKICIKNSVITKVRRITSQKNTAVISDSSEYGENDSLLTELISADDPSAEVIDNESFDILKKMISSCLSTYELKILNDYLRGYSEKETAARQKKSEKSVENALFRIRNKLKKLL